MSEYLNEAFKKFTLLEDSEDFAITPEGIENLGSFMGDAMNDEDLDIDVIDLEADTEEDLKQSYIGKVICECNVCHSHIFYNKEDIVVDDEGVANIDDECPYCMSTGGYTIIGEIKPWVDTTEEIIDEPSEKEVDEVSEEELADEPIEIEDEEETEVVEESLKRKSRKRKLTESSYIPPDYEDKYISKKVIAKVTATDYDEDENGRPYTFKLAIKEYEDGSLGWEENGGEGYANMPFDTIEEAVENYKNWADNIYGGDFIIEFAPKFSYLSESLKLDGVKSLRGVKGLKKRPEKAGVKAIRGIGDSKISGTTLEEAVSSAKYYGVDEASTGRVAFDNIDEAMDWMADYGDWLYDANDNLVLETWGRDKNGDVVSWRVYTMKDSKDYETFSDLESAKQRVMEVSTSLTESIEDVTINTEDETMTMTTKEDGGVVIETSPIEEEVTSEEIDAELEPEFNPEEIEGFSDEMVAPISDETEQEILSNESEELPEEEIEPEMIDEIPSDEEIEEEIPEEDVDVDEFEEENFDELGEAYLRKNYNNVKSFNTTQVRVNENMLMIEGVITFKNGHQKKTDFVFEAVSSKNNKFLFEGYNTQITGENKAFKLNCFIEGKKIIPESLKYDYSATNALNESVAVKGSVKTLKRK